MGLYMERYAVKRIEPEKIKNREITVSVPGSKSITNRALLLAVLAQGESTLTGVLFSDDSRHFMECVRKLGFGIQVDEDARTVKICGDAEKIPKQKAEIYVGSAGTAARFLTALLGFSKGEYFLDASGQMKKRPMASLLCSLRELGVEIDCTGQEGHFPFSLKSNGVAKKEISVNIDDSSQFLSALLISCCRTGEDFTVHVTGSHGMAYIGITTRMMGEFGVEALLQERDGARSYFVRGGQSYTGREYAVEPDLSGACYFYAMAMLLGISVRVEGVKKDTMQGDIAFLQVLEQMGGTLYETEAGIVLEGPANGRLHGVTVDMHAFSDQALTLAALAPFADAPTQITGIGHIRGQECDRIAAICTELGKLGVCCEELADGVRIDPANARLHGGTVHTYDDHRVAMSFALLGLRIPGIVIDNPSCCRKTFENYFELFGSVCHKVMGEGQGGCQNTGSGE